MEDGYTAFMGVYHGIPVYPIFRSLTLSLEQGVFSRFFARDWNWYLGGRFSEIKRHWFIWFLGTTMPRIHALAIWFRNSLPGKGFGLNAVCQLISNGWMDSNPLSLSWPFRLFLKYVYLFSLCSQKKEDLFHQKKYTQVLSPTAWKLIKTSIERQWAVLVISYWKLEGSGEEITWQKGNRLTDLPGRVSPWNGQSGPPREAGGVCGRTTQGSHLRGCPKGNQKQTIFQASAFLP